ncbi:MAG: hypothetical protein QXH42_09910 [Thermoplasmata archaeon]
MPRRSRATRQLLTQWRHYIAATRRNLSDFPDLKDELDAFEAKVNDIEATNQRQENLKAELKATTKALVASMREAARTASMLKRRWEAKYGPRSPRLRELVPATEGTVRSPPAKE